MQTLNRDIELLFQLGSLRHIERAWRQYFGIDVANDLEHSVRVAFTALLISRMEGKEVDEGTIFKMALIHDLAESLTGDLTPVQKRYLKVDEDKAVSDMFGDTAFADFVPLIMRYKERKCLESLYVKDADNLDIDLEMKELEALGHHMVEQWKPGRLKMRNEKFTTKAAGEIWDAIQNARPSAWQDTILSKE
jgi:putative hydrolase of HD superfamily